MNEQCVWIQIELDTTPALEQGKIYIFSSCLFIGPKNVTSLCWGLLVSLSLYL